MGQRARLAGVAAFALMATGCFWPAPGAGPDRTGHNPFEKKISPETVTELEETWTASVDGGSAVRSPVTSDHAVHASAGRTLYAFDVETGDRRWTRTHGSDRSYHMGPATLAHGVLWSGSFTDNINLGPVTELLDPRTGEVVSEPGMFDYPHSGVVDGVRAKGHVLSSAQLISALGPGPLVIDVRDSDDPELGWSGWIGFLNTDSWTPLTLGDDFVYLAGDEGFSVDETGNTVGGNGIRGYSTKEKPANCPPIEQFPAGFTFVCPTWFTSLDGRSATPPVLDPRRSKVYVGTSTHYDPSLAEGTVYAVDATNGEILWSTPVGSGAGAEPALAEGNLFVPTVDGRLVVLDASTGDILWEAPTGDEVLVQPAVAGGVVFTGATDGSVRAFDAGGCEAETCEPLWSESTGSEITGAPAVSQGRLYVGLAEGRLIAYGRP